LLGRDLKANNAMGPLLCNATIELLLSKHVPTETVMHAMGEMGCCLHGPCQGVIKRREFGQLVQLSSAREAEKKYAIVQLIAKN
jgi:hypothetical protein